MRGRLGRNRSQEEFEERWVPQSGHRAYMSPAGYRRGLRKRTDNPFPQAKPKSSPGPLGSQEKSQKRSLPEIPSPSRVPVT